MSDQNDALADLSTDGKTPAREKVQQMKHLQTELLKIIERDYKGKFAPMVIAAALAGVARQQLNHYDADTRKALLQGLRGYWDDVDVELEERAAAVGVTPGVLGRAIDILNRRKKHRNN